LRVCGSDRTGFRELCTSDRVSRGSYPTDRRNATKGVRSIPLITAKRISMQNEPVGACLSTMSGDESKILVTLSCPNPNELDVVS
jgi:hypothetical protein